MSSVSRFLFGGSTSKQQSSSKPVDMTPDELKPIREPFATGLTNVIRSGGVGYSGPTVAPMAAGEQSGLQGVNDAANDPFRKNLLNFTQGGGFLNGNPFLDAAIRAAQRPTLEGLQETLSRTLPGRFTNAGNFIQPQGSSAFDRAAAITSRAALNTNADIASKMSYDAFNAERERQQQTIQLGQNEVNTMIEGLKANALPRLIQQAGVDKGIEIFNKQVESLLQALQIASGAPISQIANVQQSTGKSESQKGMFAQLGSSVGAPGGTG